MNSSFVVLQAATLDFHDIDVLLDYLPGVPREKVPGDRIEPTKSIADESEHSGLIFDTGVQVLVMMKARSLSP